ncbi:MAG: radical SAM protein [Acidobacteria bacterium]|nr:radical SAM protein [Acidobacteriota bacterium]
MKLTGVHLLLTYQCTFECDHCFVWGSPRQEGTMTLATIRHVLNEARALGTVEWIYFEGGEPLLFYPILVRGVREAAESGFRVGLVSNGYWATSPEDAEVWLEPMASPISDLSLSSDLYHGRERLSPEVRNAQTAAEKLGIPVDVVSIAEPEAGARSCSGQLPHGESGVMFRGRAAETLASRAPHRPWTGFDACPHEDLEDPGRLHVDPLGYAHVCQGIALGNVLTESLKDLCERYEPSSHPICGPLLAGGPAELARRYGVRPRPEYADACHLCDQTRHALRSRFPEVLAPDQMYGVPEAG